MSGTDPNGTPGDRVRRLVFGRPRDLSDRSVFHSISLIPVLAWVGLGADGLSSSAYGPDEAFRTLFTPEGSHTYLAVALAGLMALTVFVIAAAYSRIIEEFPQGGGGYVVATKLLSPKVGLVSGCALLVDYILTITVSIAAAGDALFSFLPLTWQSYKLLIEVVLILVLVAMNLRGVRESVLLLTPIFFVFALTHLVLILGGIIGHLPQVPETAVAVSCGFQDGYRKLGLSGMLLLFVHAYSLGGGTYTGIEAVSNGLPIMREPRAVTGKRTMFYMAISLAFTAGGLLLCYLLWGAAPDPEGHKTMNAVLLERVACNLPLGSVFIVVTLLAEGALLVVAAQAGFLDGPRVVANMAVDSWMPHRFSALSERLTTHNGIVLMGVASMGALLYTKGAVRALVVMYSINVFLTFSLSMFAMARLWVGERFGQPLWKRRAALFIGGFLLCATILCVTVFEKFAEGGWLTLAVTGSVVVICLWTRRHYDGIAKRLAKSYGRLMELPKVEASEPGEVNPNEPTAALLVSSYTGAGVHAVLTVLRTFPRHFRNLVFICVGVVDSGEFKGEDALERLQKRTEETLEKYMGLARQLGLPAKSWMAISTDAVDEAEKLCAEVAVEFPRVTFFGGNLIFRREAWYQRALHNETAFAIQKRLQWRGLTMVVLPLRVD